MRNHPYTKRELDEAAKNRCGQYRNKVKKHRVNCPQNLITSTKTDSWDMPIVVVACCSTKKPYVLKTGRNNSTLRNCHPKLTAAYSCYNTRVGKKPPHAMRLYPMEPHFEAGHCAEPHAAHALLNTMDKLRVVLSITMIDFSHAINCKNNTVHDYCGTCKLVFPKLR